MKKTIKSIMALMSLAMIASSCSSDISDDVNIQKGNAKQSMTFTATQESFDMPSRTVIDGKAVKWTAGDKITIWDGTNKNEFTASTGGSTSTSITGTASTSASFYTAIYPNSVGQNCTYQENGNINGVVIPATQTATAGTCDPAAAIMAAYTTTTTLAFKNVCSFLKLTTTEAYTEIKVSVTTGCLAGQFNVQSLVSGSITVKEGTGLKTVTLVPASGESTIPAGTYYIAIASNIACNGLRIVCIKNLYDRIERSRTTSSAKKFVTNRVYNMGTPSTANGWTEYTNKEDKDGYQCVDLGLSVKWAICNVGATNDYDYGSIFAWGETTPKSGKENFTWSNYFDTTDEGTTFTKYSNDSGKKTVLDAEDDAATANWHGSWRMPTDGEIDELVNNTTQTWTTYCGVNGYILTSTKAGYTESSIFLPTAGFFWYTYGNTNVGKHGYYWANSLSTTDSSKAYRLAFVDGWFSTSYVGRACGQSVRPVWKSAE